MTEVRCTKCNKKLGESTTEAKFDSASCEKDKIIYKTRCPRCGEDIIIVFKY